MFHWASVDVIAAGGFWLTGSRWGRQLTNRETIAVLLIIFAIAATLPLFGL
jgi:hypothetical protein